MQSRILKIVDSDVIFLSYDEPNADKHYYDLQQKCPWAKRVHGVEGSDAAHKACAELSETPRFITVDADNIVNPEFFDLEINLDVEDIPDGKQISFSGTNGVNSLVYGNGGLKWWTKEFVMRMKTHENSDKKDDPKSQIEFCYESEYYQMNESYSTFWNNGSPLQAFRAGFREGVKMSLSQGHRVTKYELKEELFWQNLQRLLIWMSVGKDVPNGEWSMYGARLGCYMTTCTDWDYVQVRDFKWLNKFFASEVQPKIKVGELDAEMIRIGDILREELELPIGELDSNSSKFFKKTFNNPRRNMRRK